MKFPVQSLYNWYRTTLRNPKYRWWIILGTLAYFVSPIDISPDFLPIVGQIDDVLLVTLLVSEVSQMLIERVKSRKEENYTQASVVDGSDSTINVDPIDVEAVSAK